MSNHNLRHQEGSDKKILENTHIFFVIWVYPLALFDLVTVLIQIAICPWDTNLHVKSKEKWCQLLRQVSYIVRKLTQFLKKNVPLTIFNQVPWGSKNYQTIRQKN